MKKNLKKLWNNRIFRTFIETTLATIVGNLTCANALDLNISVLGNIVIIGVATGISAILPLCDINEHTKD